MTIEIQVALLEARLNNMEKAADERKEQQDSMAADVKEIKEQMVKYKGFIGGFVFMCSCLGAFIYYITGPLAALFKFKNG